MSSDPQPAELVLELIAEDQGSAEAGRFRIGLAMVLTMIAEIAEDQPGKAIPGQILNSLAADIIAGNERGVSFVGAHVGRMMAVRLVPMPQPLDDGGASA